MANERYLRAHPELKDMLQEFVMQCLRNQPKDIEEEAVKYFVNNQTETKTN